MKCFEKSNLIDGAWTIHFIELNKLLPQFGGYSQNYLNPTILNSILLFNWRF